MDISCGKGHWDVFINEQTNTDYIRAMNLVETIEQNVKDILGLKQESPIVLKSFNEDYLMVFIKKLIEKNKVKIGIYNPVLMAKMGNVSKNDICKALAIIDYFNQGSKVSNRSELIELIDAGFYIDPDVCKGYYQKLKDSIVNNKHSQQEVEKLYLYSLDFNDNDGRSIIRDLLLDEYFRPQLSKLTSTRQIDDYKFNIQRKFCSDDFINFIRYEISEKKSQIETNKQGFALFNDSSDTLKVTRLNEPRGYQVKEIYNEFSFFELEDFLHGQSVLHFHVQDNEHFEDFLLQFGQLDAYKNQQFYELCPENVTDLFEQYAKLFLIFQVGRMRFKNESFIDTRETLVDFIMKIIEIDGSLKLMVDFGSDYCNQSKHYFSQALAHILDAKTIKKQIFTTLSNFDNQQIISLLSEINKDVFLTIFRICIIQFFKNKPSINEIQSMRSLIFNINNEKLFNTMLLKRADILTI